MLPLGANLHKTDCFACRAGWFPVLLGSAKALGASEKVPVLVPSPGQSRVVWAVLAAAAALVCLAGALAIWLTERWRRTDAVQRLNPSQQLAHFRTLYQQGDLSSEEFERIRRLLQVRLTHSS